MAKLVWDQSGQKIYETGVKDAALYVASGSDTAKPYPLGVAWNGITGIDENPSGAETTDLYADDAKYLSMISAEDFGFTITAYTYPPEFEQCDGSAELATGVVIGQQNRTAFGLCYKTTIGNDLKGNDYGYKLHLIYGCKASPSAKSYSTINDSPEAIEFSWEVDTTPVPVEGFKPTATVVIDSTKVATEKMNALLDVLYGTDSAQPYLPLPEEVKTLLA